MEITTDNYIKYLGELLEEEKISEEEHAIMLEKYCLNNLDKFSI